MHAGFSLVFLAATAGLALACGTEGTGSFDCTQKTIENGTTVVCGRFGSSTSATYSCYAPGTLTVRTFGPKESDADSACPAGTVPGPSSPDNWSASPGGPDDGAPGTNGSPADPSTSSSSDSPPGSSSSAGDGAYVCSDRGGSTECVHTECNEGYVPSNGTCVKNEARPKGNNGVGNGVDPQPPGNPPVNDGPGTSPGHPGQR